MRMTGLESGALNTVVHVDEEMLLHAKIFWSRQGQQDRMELKETKATELMRIF